MLADTYPVHSPRTQIEVDSAVRHWSRHFGTRDLSTIKPADLAAFSTAMLVDHAPATVNKTRRHLRALLRWAVDNCDLDSVPAWKPLREPYRAPQAFLAEEFGRIVQVAGDWPGWIAGVEAGPWWRSLLLSIWYSGGRIGAVLQVVWDDVLPTGFYLRAAHQKQAADQLFIVGQDCREALSSVRLPKRVLVWPWPHRRETLYRQFRRICGLAKVPLDHGVGCAFHRIRKSTASYLSAAGGDATAQLGHSCSSVTRRYLDPRIVGAHDSTGAMPRLG